MSEATPPAPDASPAPEKAPSPVDAGAAAAALQQAAAVAAGKTPPPPPPVSMVPPVPKTPRNREPVSADPFTWEKKLLYGLLAAVLGAIIVAVFLFGASTHDTYATAIKGIPHPPTTADVAFATITLALGRAKDFALVKGAALLLSFLVVVIGALMVVKGAEVSYKLGLETGAHKSSLETSSPGLVMITLGLALALGVLLTKSVIRIGPPAPDLQTPEFATQSAPSAPNLETAGENQPLPP